VNPTINWLQSSAEPVTCRNQVTLQLRFSFKHFQLITLTSNGCFRTAPFEFPGRSCWDKAFITQRSAWYLASWLGNSVSASLTSPVLDPYAQAKNSSSLNLSGQKWSYLVNVEDSTLPFTTFLIQDIIILLRKPHLFTTWFWRNPVSPHPDVNFSGIHFEIQYPQCAYR